MKLTKSKYNCNIVADIPHWIAQCHPLDAAPYLRPHGERLTDYGFGFLSCCRCYDGAMPAFAIITTPPSMVDTINVVSSADLCALGVRRVCSAPRRACDVQMPPGWIQEVDGSGGMSALVVALGKVAVCGPIHCSLGRLSTAAYDAWCRSVGFLSQMAMAVSGQSIRSHGQVPSAKCQMPNAKMPRFGLPQSNGPMQSRCRSIKAVACGYRMSAENITREASLG